MFEASEYVRQNCTERAERGVADASELMAAGVVKYGRSQAVHLISMAQCLQSKFANLEQAGVAMLRFFCIGAGAILSFVLGATCLGVPQSNSPQVAETQRIVARAESDSGDQPVGQVASEQKTVAPEPVAQASVPESFAVPDANEVASETLSVGHVEEGQTG